MARKKIKTGSIEEVQKAELSNRIWQIRQSLFDDNNRVYSQKICVNEQALSQICSGKRNAGIEIVQRILENIPEISPDWLLLGRGKMLRQNDAMYETDREGAQYKAVEGNDGWNRVTIADLQRENERLWQRYDDAQQLIGSLRAELKAVRERAAEYAKEKTEPSGTTTQVEG